MKYPVYETFNAWQGEGSYSGRSAFFIRLYGCPLHCHFCDSAGTWHPKHVPANIRRATADELFDECVKGGRVRMVVITGGEPCVHDLRPLVEKFYGSEIAVHLETSGAYEIECNMLFEHIVVSPKWAKRPLQSSIDRASELKLIVENERCISRWMETAIGNATCPIWLNPEWSQRHNPKVLNSISKAVMSDTRFRAGYQLHKLYNVDSLDGRSQKLVPLGGEGSLL